LTTPSRIGLLGSRGYISHSDTKDINEIIREIGENSGNLVFQRAGALMLDESFLFIGPGCDAHEDGTVRARSECHAILFPAANHINIQIDLGAIADWLRGMGHPVAVVGIGAQAPDSSHGTFESIVERFENDNGFKQLMDFFRESYVRVGVRGEFTRKLLARFNVPCSITGCPSFVMNQSINLGSQLEQRFAKIRADVALEKTIRLAITASSPWDSEAVLDVERKLIRLLQQHQGIYVQQSGGDKSLILATQRFASEEQRQELYAWYEQRLRTGLGADGLKAFLQTYLTIFFNVDTWQEALSGCEFSMGSRYHGNALALQTGIPAVALVHDSRTEELCHSTCVPYLSLEQFHQEPTLQGVLANVAFDGKAYDAHRQTCAKEFISMLKACGMKPSRQLLILAAQAA
jgi:hypothetical protein